MLTQLVLGSSAEAGDQRQGMPLFVISMRWLSYSLAVAVLGPFMTTSGRSLERTAKGRGLVPLIQDPSKVGGRPAGVQKPGGGGEVAWVGVGWERGGSVHPCFQILWLCWGVFATFSFVSRLQCCWNASVAQRHPAFTTKPTPEPRARQRPKLPSPVPAKGDIEMLGTVPAWWTPLIWPPAWSWT
jgi:hypothetical protein